MLCKHIVFIILYSVNDIGWCWAIILIPQLWIWDTLILISDIGLIMTQIAGSGVCDKRGRCEGKPKHFARRAHSILFHKVRMQCLSQARCCLTHKIMIPNDFLSEEYSLVILHWYLIGIGVSQLSKAQVTVSGLKKLHPYSEWAQFLWE